MIELNWDRLSSDGVRAVRVALGTEKIHGRHVNCVNGRGAKRIHGKVHVVGNETYIESMLVETANLLMKKEMGNTKPKSNFISAWSNNSSVSKSEEEPKTVKVSIEKPNKKRRNTTVPIYAQT